MSHHYAARLTALILSNILLPIAVLVFASGFFPYKPLLPGLADFADVQNADVADVEQHNGAFDRVVFMVVDALRSDFVFGYGSAMEFTQSLISSGSAIPFTAHATPPTVTMPRVKALTTGSVPSFLDLILNFAESDTSSSLEVQDTWLAQIKAKGGKLVFYGDDTWLKLFPGNFFARADGTSSFFVSDFTEVDNNVTRHVPTELARSDWNAMIMHYLGMDHIGHKTGPQGPNMLPKQKEMDDIVRQIFEAIETEKHLSNTLLVLTGDHGMNAGGNHGGSGPGETEPALLFASPKFKDMRRRETYPCPTAPREGTEFHFYTKLEQNDVVPTLAGLMGIPMSKNSLGVYIRELLGLWNQDKTFRLLRQNAEQMLHIIRAKHGVEDFQREFECQYRQLAGDHDAFQCVRPVKERDVLAQKWAYAKYTMNNWGRGSKDNGTIAENTMYEFLHYAQESMSATASSYNIPRMVAGMGLTSLVLMCVLFFGTSSLAPSFFGITSMSYAMMMFASSYVEEEQHFWYWLTPAWIVLVAAGSFIRLPTAARALTVTVATTALLALHRVCLRWNQTGQKYAGAPDIAHTIFPQHHMVMWILILATYIYVGFGLHNRSFAGIFMPELAAFMNVCLLVPAIVFKLNFTQADAPELVQGLAVYIRKYSEPFDLVFQARAVFSLLAATAVVVVGLSIQQSRTRPKGQIPENGERIALVERLHPLLTLFLMTQTRASNVPLLLVLEIQHVALSSLIDPVDPGWSKDSRARTTLTRQVATSTLLLSHVYYFCMGGSNSISSIDLSNAYNGVADYNIAAVGVLLFASNWAGPVWWCSSAVLLLLPKKAEECSTPNPPKAEGVRDWVAAERVKLHEQAVATVKTSEKSNDSPEPLNTDAEAGLWMLYIAHMTAFIATALLAVMAACTVLRTHLFIWTVFSPKYLYIMAWSVGWHLIINIGFGSVLRLAGRVV